MQEWDNYWSSNPLGRICAWFHRHRASFGRRHRHRIRCSCISTFCRLAVWPWSYRCSCNRSQIRPPNEVFHYGRFHNRNRSLLQVCTPRDSYSFRYWIWARSSSSHHAGNHPDSHICNSACSTSNSPYQVYSKG
jgi:hypothetical protein